MNYVVREAKKADGEAALALLPRLAAFELPDSRTAEHLWRHDAALLQRWLADKTDNCFVHVAEEDGGKIIGVAITTTRPEILSHEPSAHLEALAVAVGAEGRGVGKQLLGAAEACAIEHGAQTITLHVFTSNTRARRLYEGAGFDGELMRYIKPIGA